MLLDVIKSCPCLEMLEVNLAEDVTASHVEQLRETVQNYVPRLARVLGLDEDGKVQRCNKIFFRLSSEREVVVHRWLEEPRTAGRVCCMLRLLFHGFGSVRSLETSHVCRYAAGALRQALEADSPGDCITIAYGVLDCM